MPFAGAGAFIGNSHAASANTNLVFETGNNGTLISRLINTDGLCGMSVCVQQTAGVVGTGAVTVQALPRADVGPFYDVSTTAIAALGVFQTIEINHLATRAVRLIVTGSGVPANPNAYSILFSACI